MVDYKKLKKRIIITLAALDASLALLIGVQYYQKVQSQKAFEKLPKAQQEVVIKLRESKTPDKTIQINIDAYNKLIEITNTYNSSIDRWEKSDSINAKITNLDEKVQRITYKYNDIRVLVDVIRWAKSVREQFTLFDTTKIDELIASMELSKTKLEADITALKKLSFK